MTTHPRVGLLSPPGRRTLLAVLLAALAALAGWAAPGARADCGGVERARPAHASFLPPLAIGDSTMLFALPALAREGFQANAHGCRQFPEALDLLRRLARGRLLPHLVVVALGADGSVTAADIGRTLAVLGPRRLLVLVTPRELGGGSGADAATVRAAGRSRPSRVRVLDWVRFAAGHGAWFQPDGLHLTLPGAQAFAGFLARVLPLARAAPPAAPPPSCPTRAPGGGPAGLDPAAPRVAVVVPAGVLATTIAQPGAVSLGLRNANPFAVAGVLTMAPLAPAPGGALPAATVCVALPAGGEQTVALDLGAGLRRLLDVRQRFPVRVELRVYDAAGATAATAAVYRLERSAGHPPLAGT